MAKHWSWNQSVKAVKGGGGYLLTFLSSFLNPQKQKTLWKNLPKNLPNAPLSSSVRDVFCSKIETAPGAIVTLPAHWVETALGLQVDSACSTKAPSYIILQKSVWNKGFHTDKDSLKARQKVKEKFTFLSSALCCLHLANRIFPQRRLQLGKNLQNMLQS